ncbi:TolC family protein [Caulobacter segnis]|uniref:RND efflux system, outer membrane lipoprotein, NodT family n=2 Tax=Caulobacter segnis TaxID=88688 RepID=D5VGE0_CAUST|nr:TolC family protein [Caulobacter segnis]ADG10259.1 RND efflux system, outer membrane lipoprotein, NodT family [Caulobacter segnis ATCC 21756]AVQ01998.1 TolC family protein [Caulobacter segnis]
MSRGRRGAAIAAAVAAASGLAGCGAHLRAADVALPAAYAGPASGQAQDPKAPQAFIERWWAGFGDPQLDALIAQAFRSSPDARAAQASLAEARAVRQGALSGFGPQGTPSVSALRQKTRPGEGRADLEVLDWDVSWEIDVIGRRGAARTSADATLAAAAFDFEATRVSLAANVAQALFQARALETQAREAEETARIAGDLARVAKLKADRGILSQADAASFRAELASSKAQAAQLQAQAKVQRRALMVLVGQARDPLDALPLQHPDLEPPTPPTLAPGQLLIRRPDLRRAQANVEAAAGRVVSARLAQLPTLSLIPSLTATRPQAGPSVSVWTLGANLAAPVLDLPRLRAQSRLRSAQAEAAVLAYERAVGEAYAETENALVTFGADRERFVELAEAERQAKAAFDAQDQGFRAGYVDATALLQTERVWRQARASLIAGRAAVLNDAVLAFKSLGGGWSPAEVMQLAFETSHDR